MVKTMIHDALPGAAAEPCRYGSSRLSFRGPARPLDGRHIAFVGGSETVARGVAEPFPALLEGALGEVCINFGQHNASVEAFLHDPVVADACRDATVTVVAATGAANLSNRLYAVHPRRNDRVVRASASLRVLFPEVDFAEICFTRHLLLTLHAAAPDRFGIVREELRIAWIARMRTLLDRIGPRAVLLWLAPHPPPSETGPEPEEGPLGRDPLFVSAPMVEGLRPLVQEVVVVPSGPGGGGPDQAAHQRAAEALAAPIRALLPPAESGRTSA